MANLKQAVESAWFNGDPREIDDGEFAKLPDGHEFVAHPAGEESSSFIDSLKKMFSNMLKSGPDDFKIVHVKDGEEVESKRFKSLEDAEDWVHGRMEDLE